MDGTLYMSRSWTPPSALTGCERTVSTDAAAVSDAGGLRLFADELPTLSGHGPLSLPAEAAVFSGGGGGAGDAGENP